MLYYPGCLTAKSRAPARLSEGFVSRGAGVGPCEHRSCRGFHKSGSKSCPFQSDRRKRKIRCERGPRAAELTIRTGDLAALQTRWGHGSFESGSSDAEVHFFTATDREFDFPQIDLLMDAICADAPKALEARHSDCGRVRSREPGADFGNLGTEIRLPQCVQITLLRHIEEPPGLAGDRAAGP